MKKIFTWGATTWGTGMYIGMCFWVLPQISHAFGVSPGAIEVDNLKPTSTAQVTTNISRANPSTNDEVQISVEGSGATAIILPELPLHLPQGEVSVPFTFTIQPKDLSPGTYTAQLTYIYKAASDEIETNIAILPGIETKVQFTVTNEEIIAIAINSLEIIGDSPNPTITYSVVNTGNVPAGATRLDINYVDVTTKQQYSEARSGDQLGVATPFSTQIVTLPLNTTLPPGLYQATFSFYIGDDPLYTTAPIHLQIPDDDIVKNQEVATSNLQSSHSFGSTVWFILSSMLFVLSISMAIMYYMRNKKS